MNNKNLTKWASIAELIAGVGVILSLIFVGLQINEGNRETRAATLQAATDSEMFMQSQFIRYAGLWEKLIIGATIEKGEETRKAIILYNMIMTDFENRYYQFEAGYFDAESWENRVSSLRRIVALPFFETWRGTMGAVAHSPGFLELVDDLSELQQ
jgi:hypothetical protein